MNSIPSITYNPVEKKKRFKNSRTTKTRRKLKKMLHKYIRNEFLKFLKEELSITEEMI